jgi:type I restriction enzyme S subunit
MATPENLAEIAEVFGLLIRPIFERLTVNGEQEDTLSAMRDLLLPRLVSGRLRIPEAERMVEAAVA